MYIYIEIADHEHRRYTNKIPHIYQLIHTFCYDIILRVVASYAFFKVKYQLSFIHWPSGIQQ